MKNNKKGGGEVHGESFASESYGFSLDSFGTRGNVLVVYWLSITFGCDGWGSQNTKYWPLATSFNATFSPQSGTS